jgi:hypothetical protein
MKLECVGCRVVGTRFAILNEAEEEVGRGSFIVITRQDTFFSSN